MPTGYSLPLSPRGTAGLVEPPPWHYAGDLLAVEFWTDPAEAAATLPPTLTVDPDTAGRGLALFIDWQYAGRDIDQLQPARSQYREFMVLLDARHGQRAVAWCPYIYVDNDAALARGWIQGFPKKMADVHQTRIFAAPGPASPRLAPGGRFAADASVAGHHLARAEVTLRTPVTEPERLLARPTVNRRYFPQLAAGRHDVPAVDELVLAAFDDLHLVDAWAGEGHLEFLPVPHEELGALAPVRTGLGVRASLSYTVNDLITL
ncbi:acetoacetate decarboxylase family protein [Micromonospora mangrovi]|uniref:Acetoacetate decarboxylase family protein n=2 Tax=Micromonospora TaxID=1873 RepID=A0AAU8HLW0_9ACTN